MSRDELAQAISQLGDYQIEQLTKMVNDFLALNKELADTKPHSCPYCGQSETHFVKRGFSGGKQRYQCPCCGRRFTYDHGKITAYSHLSPEKWATFVKATLELRSLDHCAELLGVSHQTAFSMRHKLLMFLEGVIGSDQTLGDLVEADETYVLTSQKGQKVEDRKPRKHGEGASRRGISKEQLCVCVASDRDGHAVAQCVNRARPTSKDIVTAIGDSIAEKTVLLCDGLSSYNLLAREKNCNKVVLKDHTKYDKVHHLNTVNGLHSRLQKMLAQLRGISTKYLNRYLALFISIETAGTSYLQEMTDLICRKIGGLNLFVPIRILNSEGILTI